MNRGLAEAGEGPQEGVVRFPKDVSQGVAPLERKKSERGVLWSPVLRFLAGAPVFINFVAAAVGYTQDIRIAYASFMFMPIVCLFSGGED
jgi:hypothetical protein